MKRTQKKLFNFLENHESITEVLYPGNGGMVSFRILDEAWVNPFSAKFKANQFC